VKKELSDSVWLRHDSKEQWLEVTCRTLWLFGFGGPRSCVNSDLEPKKFQMTLTLLRLEERVTWQMWLNHIT